MWAGSALITGEESDLSYYSGKGKQAQMKYNEGPMATHWGPSWGAWRSCAYREPDWGHWKPAGKCAQRQPCTGYLSHFVCLNKMVSGYKAANLFAFLLCFVLVQDFISSWCYSKCTKKNNGSPWIPWFGWNWLQWWHLCKYCSLQTVLSGNSALTYMGSFLCCSLYILSSSYHI